MYKLTSRITEAHWARHEQFLILSKLKVGTFLNLENSGFQRLFKFCLFHYPVKCCGYLTFRFFHKKKKKKITTKTIYASLGILYQGDHTNRSKWAIKFLGKIRNQMKLPENVTFILFCCFKPLNNHFLMIFFLKNNNFFSTSVENRKKFLW